MRCSRSSSPLPANRSDNWPGAPVDGQKPVLHRTFIPAVAPKSRAARQVVADPVLGVECLPRRNDVNFVIALGKRRQDGGEGLGPIVLITEGTP